MRPHNNIVIDLAFCQTPMSKPEIELSEIYLGIMLVWQWCGNTFRKCHNKLHLQLNVSSNNFTKGFMQGHYGPVNLPQ